MNRLRSILAVILLDRRVRRRRADRELMDKMCPDMAEQNRRLFEIRNHLRSQLARRYFSMSQGRIVRR